MALMRRCVWCVCTAVYTVHAALFPSSIVWSLDLSCCHVGSCCVALCAVLDQAVPTIPPMTRAPFSNLVPDYVVLGASAKAWGWAG